MRKNDLPACPYPMPKERLEDRHLYPFKLNTIPVGVGVASGATYADKTVADVCRSSRKGQRKQSKCNAQPAESAGTRSAKPLKRFHRKVGASASTNKGFAKWRAKNAKGSVGRSKSCTTRK